MNRIRNGYKAGNGDLGYSLILDGTQLSKDDPACWIYSEMEHLNNKISEYLVTFDVQYPDLKQMLIWLKDNSFSISGFCFLKGSSDRHNLNLDVSEELELLVTMLKGDELVGEAADFVHHTRLKYIKLDGIRISVRDLERAFTKWRNHDVVKDFIISTVKTEPMKAQAIALNIDAYSGFLNRLSTFIWLSTRKEAEICGDFDSQKYWSGKMSSVDK